MRVWGATAGPLAQHTPPAVLGPLRPGQAVDELLGPFVRRHIRLDTQYRENTP